MINTFQVLDSNLHGHISAEEEAQFRFRNTLENVTTNMYRKNGGQRVNGKRSKYQIDVLPTTEYNWDTLIALHSALFLCIQLYNVHRFRIGDLNLVAVLAVVCLLFRNVLSCRRHECAPKLRFFPQPDLTVASFHTKRPKQRTNCYKYALPSWLLNTIHMTLTISTLTSTLWKLRLGKLLYLLSILSLLFFTVAFFRWFLNHVFVYLFSTLEYDRRNPIQSLNKAAYFYPKVHTFAPKRSAFADPPAVKRVDQLETLKKISSFSVTAFYIKFIFLYFLEACFDSFLVGDMAVLTAKVDAPHYDRSIFHAVRGFCYVGTIVLMWLRDLSTEADLWGHLSGLIGCWYPVKSPMESDGSWDDWDCQLAPYTEGQVARYRSQLFVSVGWLNTMDPMWKYGRALMTFREDPIVVYNWMILGQIVVSVSSMALTVVLRLWSAMAAISLLSLLALFLCIEGKKVCRRRMEAKRKSDGKANGHSHVNGYH